MFPTIDTISENIKMDPVELRHQDLERVDDSIFKSECPFCEEGILPVKRDMITFHIMSEDMCISCGRRVKYTDIATNTIVLKYLEDDE